MIFKFNFFVYNYLIKINNYMFKLTKIIYLHKKKDIFLNNIY